MAPLADRYELPSRLRQAPRPTLVRPERAGAVDPRTGAAFMAGAIWHPEEGISGPDGDGNRTWTSQATAGTVLTTAGSFQPPTPDTASNGAPVWKFNGANGSIHYGTGGSTGVDASVRFGPKGVIAIWAKAGENDTAIHTLVNQWSGNSVNDRIDFTTGVSGIANRMVVNGSDDGTSTAGDGSHRWKANRSAVDYTQWNKFVLWIDFDGINYSDVGGNFSTKLIITGNGLPLNDIGYSAPPAPFSDPPGGPVVGTGLYTGASRFNIGGDYISSCWWTNVGTWQIGAVLIANGLDGLTPALVQRCLDWNAPA